MPKKNRASQQKTMPPSLARKFVNACQPIARFIIDFSKQFIGNLRQSLKRWDPWFSWIGSTSSALSSFVSTLKLTPVIFSSLTVLSTIPLFHIVLPSVIFEPMIFTPIVLAIAGITAYKTYKDAIDRDNLDNKIEEHEEKVCALEKENALLSKKLTLLESHFKDFKSRQERLNFKLPKHLQFRPKVIQESDAQSAVADKPIINKRKSATIAAI